MLQTILRLLSFLRFILKRFNEDRCPQIAASLTFTTLLTLVPVVTIALVVISAFPVFSDLMVQFKVFLLLHLVPELAGLIITDYMEEFSRKAAGLTSLGIVFLAFTALMLMLTIERAFNTIWRVFTMRPVAQRLVVYWALLSLGPLLVGGSLSVTSYLAGLSLGWLSGESLNHLGLLKLVPLLLTVAAFSLLYFAVPNRYVPLPHALAGGIIAALFFEMMKKGFTVYITKFTSFMLIYGAFAAIPIFLLWIYFSWTVILFGALVAANLSHWHAGDWWKQKTAVHRFISLLRVLRLLYIAQRRGESIGMKQFHRDLKLSLDELEDVLKQLRSVQWVRRVGRDAWILVRDLEDIRLADVYHRFVFSAADAPILSEDDHLAGLFSDIAARQDEAMSISLKSLYSRS